MPSALPAPQRRADYRVWAFGGLLLAAAWLAWSNSFDGEFVLDDMPAITENPSIRSFATAFSPPGDGQTVSGRPLVNLSFALNWAIARENVRSYHVLNLAIHALAALALFGVARRTLLRQGYGGQALGLAVAIAAIWALHPLQTESVTYVSQRAESMAGLCLLLTLYAATRGAEAANSGCQLLVDNRPTLHADGKTECHIMGDNPQSRSATALAWHALAFVACLAGMGSKEIMYAAPVLVLLHDRTFFAGTFREALRRRPWFYAALASTWLLLGWLVWQTGNRGLTAGFGLGISPWHYLLTQCEALVHYLRLALWPTPLILDYGFAVVDSAARVWPQAILLIALFAATVVGVVRRTPWGFMGAWFFLLLAPSSSVLPVATQTIAEHRMYLPLATVIAAGVAGLWSIFGRRSVIAFTLLALVLGVLTARRNTDYRTAVGLWQDTAAKRPGNARAFGELANTLHVGGRNAESIPIYERALRLMPVFPKARHNYAGALADGGRLDEAAKQFELAITQAPTLADAYYGLGNVRRQQGRTADAIACYEAAVRVRPHFALAHNNLANLLDTTGRLDEALAHFAAATRAAPNFADAHYNWGNTLARAGRSAEAVPRYEAAVRIAPGHVNARENLGVSLLLTGRIAEGIRELEIAQRLAPDRESIRNNLAVARQRAAK